MSGSKNPRRIAAGQASARARWGWEPDIPKIVKIHDLTPDQRRLVMALVEAQRANNAKAGA